MAKRLILTILVTIVTIAPVQSALAQMAVFDPAAYAQMILDNSEKLERWGIENERWLETAQGLKDRAEEFKQMMGKLRCTHSELQGVAYARDRAKDARGIDRLDTTEDLGYQYADVATCLTDGNQRENLREAVRDRIKKMRENDEAIDTIDEDDEAIKAAMAQLEARDKELDEEFETAGADVRHRAILLRAQTQAGARESRMRAINEKQAALATQATHMRAAAAGKINDVEGMLEALQLMLEFDNTMSTQLTSISVALQSQTEVLRSMHEIARSQLEIARLRPTESDRGRDDDGGDDSNNQGRATFTAKTVFGDPDDKKSSPTMSALRKVEH